METSNIPSDIIRHILLQLPMKSVIRCQCVCKQWRLLIQDSDFKLSYRGQGRAIILTDEFKRSRNLWKSRFFVRFISHDHGLQRQKWPFGDGYPLIRGSNKYCVRLCCCNGLVLVVAESDLLLWNPSTMCSTKVLERPYPEESKPVILAGLCYDSCTRDYKAVLLLRRSNHGFGHPFVVSASLNHKEWRPVQFPYSLDSTRGSVDFSNTFHWWVSDIKDRDHQDFSSGNRIVYFDPVSDEFRILPTPELRSGRENAIVGLGVIDECLCMACIVHEEEEPKPKTKIRTKTIQVLIMKEYGRQESWMTAFAIQMPQLANTYSNYGLTLTFYSQKKNAQEVLFLRRGLHWGNVYVYDRKKDELKEILMNFLRTSSLRYIVSMCFHVESLDCPGHNGLIDLGR